MFIESLLCATVLVFENTTKSVIKQLKYNLQIAEGSFEVRKEG